MNRFYAPKGMILWDSWFIKQGRDFHLFHLQSPMTKDTSVKYDTPVSAGHLDIPASVGHAVSRDLKKWKQMPTALEPGQGGAWDNLAIWTGSAIEKDGKYFMFYTGRNKKSGIRWIQKIGLATSDDLISWEKYSDNPILEADNNIYEMRNGRNAIGNVGVWRDPYVFQDPKSKKYYMLISARKKGSETEYNGCIAIAESQDLITWKILPPLLAPQIYDEMEVPQMIIHDSKYYLFFSTHASGHKPGQNTKVTGLGGRYCYYSTELFGEYKPVNKNGVVLAHEEEIYDLTIATKEKNKYLAIGWLNKDEQGNFIGKLSQPIELTIDDDKVVCFLK